MNNKLNFVLLLILCLIFSCKYQNKENDSQKSVENDIINEQNDITEENMLSLDKAKHIELLQGKWKESKYPFRKAEFEDSKVKFVEEGIPEEPAFEKFELSRNCPFDTNNIQDVKATDIILILPDKNRCEKLTISEDTLILYGYSTNLKDTYEIYYLREKN